MSSEDEVSEYDSDVEAHVELGDFKYSGKKSATKTSRSKPRLRSVVVPKGKKQKKSNDEDDDMILSIDDAADTPKKSRRGSTGRSATSSRTKAAASRQRKSTKTSTNKKQKIATQDSDSDVEPADDDDFQIESDEDDGEDAESDVEIYDDDLGDLEPATKRRKTAGATPTKKKRVEESDDEGNDTKSSSATPKKASGPKKAASRTKQPEQDDDDMLTLTPAKKKRKQRSNADSDNDDEKPKPKRQRTTKPKPPKKTAAASASNDDIMDVDALGDFAAEDDEFGDAAFDEVDEKKPIPAADGDLNIVLDAPEESEEPSNPKKRKRVSDVKIRRATKEEKEHAVLLHQAHLLSLMASYLLHSRAADNALLQAAVISFMSPSSLNSIAPSKQADVHESQPASKKKTSKKTKKSKSAAEAEEDQLEEAQRKPYAEQEINDAKQNISSLLKEFKSHFQVSESLFPFDLTRDSMDSLLQRPSNPLDIVYRLLAKLAHQGPESQPLELQEAVMAFVALCRGLGVPTRLVAVLKPMSWKVTNITLTQTLSGLNGAPASKKMLADLHAKDESASSLESELKKSLSAALSSFSPASRSSSTQPVVINIESDNDGVKQDPSRQTADGSAPELARGDTIPLQAIAGLLENAKEEQKAGQVKRRRKSKGGAVDPPSVWLEVYCPKSRRWLPIDVLRDLIDEPSKFQGSEEPLVYVFACEGKLITDVTRRYCERWSLSLRQIPNYEWLEKTLTKYNARHGRATDDQVERAVFEQKEFSSALEKEPFPTSQEQYRHHPLYVLEKYVGKYDMLWPPDQPALGYFKNQPIYPRKNVYHLHTREKWIQHGMQVKDGEQCVKTMRKITYKKNEEDIKESEYFGEWQTETYKPPPIVDGIIPKNEYGNVYLFKKEMMPIGGVQVSLPGIKQVCKKLQIDFAEALVGWEHVTGRFSKPQFDGVIIAEENRDVVVAAWQQNNERKQKEEAKKAGERALKNWIRLVKTLMAKNKISSAYKRDTSTEKAEQATDKKKSKPKKKATPLEVENSQQGPHEHTFPKDMWQQISDTKWLKVCACGFSVPFEQM